MRTYAKATKILISIWSLYATTLAYNASNSFFVHADFKAYLKLFNFFNSSFPVSNFNFSNFPSNSSATSLQPQHSSLMALSAGSITFPGPSCKGNLANLAFVHCKSETIFSSSIFSWSAPEELW